MVYNFDTQFIKAFLQIRLKSVRYKKIYSLNQGDSLFEIDISRLVPSNPENKNLEI